jgi:hypothetical protein
MALTNEQMIAGRFAKLARGRKLFAKMNATWDRGGFVRIGTATRYTDLKPKHRELIVLGKSGSLYMRRGRQGQHLDCIDFGTFQFAG